MPWKISSEMRMEFDSFLVVREFPIRRNRKVYGPDVVIAARIGGIPERIVHGRNGFLLSRAILRISFRSFGAFHDDLAL